MLSIYDEYGDIIYQDIIIFDIIFKLNGQIISVIISFFYFLAIILDFNGNIVSYVVISSIGGPNLDVNFIFKGNFSFEYEIRKLDGSTWVSLSFLYKINIYNSFY